MNHEEIAIITDSCADIPREFIEKYHIYVLPMQINYSGGRFRDGIDITAEEVYELQKKELLHSSTPSGEDIESLFSMLEENGIQKAIAIMLGSGISGTINHVRLAADDSRVDCFLIDSLSASIGCGASVMQTALWREEGFDFDTLCQKAAKLCKSTKVFFTLNTLEYLAKGGRINKTTAVAGNMLNIKPMLSFDSVTGEIYVPLKIRGTKLLETKMIELIAGYTKESHSENRPYNLMVADGGNVEEGNHLQEKLTEAFPNAKQVFRAQIGATLGVYLGPKLLGVGIQFLD